jgi:hypothetical protein
MQEKKPELQNKTNSSPLRDSRTSYHLPRQYKVNRSSVRIENATHEDKDEHIEDFESNIKSFQN